ncbi:MAG: type III pantothenate kinase [Gammaproteobacteria bacterium]|nr:type III pantothenate kinase [Gammaproteobacteria bacterium]
MNVLLVDVGNTRLKWRLQDGGQVLRSGAMPLADLSSSQLARHLPAEVNHVYWASVASQDSGRCLEAWAKDRHCPCQQVTTQAHWSGLFNGYERPEQLGVDRWLAMVAARRRTNNAVCVVDCGSAITFDYVSAEGRHEGGYIIPGSQLMVQALLSDAAQIEFMQQSTDHHHPGTTTAQAVLAGCGKMAIQGACDLVIEAQAQGYEILLCGGDGLAIANKLGLVYIEGLVLDGLAEVSGL